MNFGGTAEFLKITNLHTFMHVISCDFVDLKMDVWTVYVHFPKSGHIKLISMTVWLAFTPSNM